MDRKIVGIGPYFFYCGSCCTKQPGEFETFNQIPDRFICIKCGKEYSESLEATMCHVKYDDGSGC